MSSQLRHENTYKQHNLRSVVPNKRTMHQHTGTLDGLSSDHVMISFEEPAHVSGLNEIRADLENLTLSEGVKNMSPNLPGMEGLSVVV